MADRTREAKAALDRALVLSRSDRDVLNKELVEQLHQLGHGLDADQRDWTLAKELDEVRLNAFMEEGKFDTGEWRGITPGSSPMLA